MLATIGVIVGVRFCRNRREGGRERERERREMRDTRRKDVRRKRARQ